MQAHRHGSCFKIRLSLGKLRRAALRRPPLIIAPSVRRCSSVDEWASGGDLAALRRHDAAGATEARNGADERLAQGVAGGEFAASDDHRVTAGCGDLRASAREKDVDSGNVTGLEEALELAWRVDIAPASQGSSRW
jgi:hypothetical protein